MGELSFVEHNTQIHRLIIDREGRRLTDGGGTLLLGSELGQNGPGHTGLYTHPHPGNLYLSDHDYPDSGTPWATLGLRLIEWRQGWPQVVSTPQTLTDLR